MSKLKEKKKSFSIIELFKDKKQLKNELIAGCTAFVAISYIIIVNPMILKDAGIPIGYSMCATIFSSAIGCFLMAFWAKAPIVMTPGMGINAFFTYTIVNGMQLSWQEAIAISICSSIVYFVIAISGFSMQLAKAIPDNLKTGITAGIGLFLVELGLEKAHLIQAGGEQGLLMMGDLAQPATLLGIVGLIVSLILYLRGTPGAFLLGILLTTVLSLIFHIQDQMTTTKLHFSEFQTYFKNIGPGDFREFFSLPFILAVFSMSMILIFESMGILSGILPNKKRFKQSFQSSSVASFISGFLGTSPTVVAAESAVGIESGGRTGGMAFVAGCLFLVAIFTTPFLALIPQVATAPVIIITGAIMMQQLRTIDLFDFSEWFPAFLIVVLIPFSNSISFGLAIGFISYPIVKLAGGQRASIHPIVYGLASLFLIDLICQAVFL